MPRRGKAATLARRKKRAMKNAFIGSPIERVEDFRFLTGRGQYVDDLASEQMLHAVILRSSVAHGRIRAHRLRRRRGRGRAFMRSSPRPTSADVPTIPLRHDPTPAIQALRAADHRRRQGPLSSASRSPSSSPIARRLPRTRWRPSPSISSRCRRWPIATRPAGKMSSCSRPSAPICADTITAMRGDADAAFKAAPYTRREHFRVQRHAAVPMEPRGLVGRVGRRARAHHGERRLQGAVHQPPRAGADDELAGERRCAWSNTTSAAASARAASFIPRIFSFPLRRGCCAARSSGSRIGART